MSEKESPEKRLNHFQYDDKQDVIIVRLFMDNTLAETVGSLELAKDYVKAIHAQKLMKKAATEGLIVPGGNGKGDLRVL